MGRRGCGGGLEAGVGPYLRDGRRTFPEMCLSRERPTFVGKVPLPKGKSQGDAKFDCDGDGGGTG